MPSLRESCSTKEGMFDQLTSEEAELDKIREIDEKMARLDQMKRELYESMTKPRPKNVV